MANQRARNKKKVQVWLTDEEKEALEAAARERGFPGLTPFFKSLVEGLKPAMTREEAAPYGAPKRPAPAKAAAPPSRSAKRGTPQKRGK